MNSTNVYSAVHISQFYPCSRVSLASELYYICELGKYLGAYDKCLSLDGVILDKCLYQSRFWDYLRVASKNGWVTDIGIGDDQSFEISYQSQFNLTNVRNIFITEDKVEFDAEDARKRSEDLAYNWLTPKYVQVSFKEKNNEYWLWGIEGSSPEGEIHNQQSLNVSNASQSWVSLTAYVAVNRLIHKAPQRFGIEFGYSVLINKQCSVSDILLLSTKTDALNGWFSMLLDTSEANQLQCGYEAWYHEGHELGYMKREYDAVEKFTYFQSLGLKLGDIVLIYERNECQQNNFIKTIANMHFAIVRGVSKQEITLEIVNNKKTVWGYEKMFQSLSPEIQVMYRDDKNYRNYRPKMQTFSWYDIGMNYMLRSELFFITPLQLEDSVALDVSDGESDECLLLDEEEAIYWLLKDYNVEFNEEHYREVYFGSKVPAYDRYMNGDSCVDIPRFKKS